MALSRYSFSPKISNGKILGKTDYIRRIQSAITSGRLAYSTMVLEEGMRLDHIAASSLGNSSLWWVIAAASEIGWSLQVPPGTIIRIPTDLGQIYGLIS